MKKIDVALGLAFALLGGALGIAVLIQSGWLFFYQSFTPEIVYSACGYGFKHPGAVPPKLMAFLLRETLTFNCADIDANAALAPPGLFSLLQLYFSLVVSFTWRQSSVSYQNLWPVVGVLTGLYAAGCFVLLRQFFGRLPATVGATFLTVSPIALPIIVSFRDYSKAPFFIWAVIFLVLALRARRLRILVGWVVAGALAIGIGCGFRADLIILLPLSVLALIIVFDIRLLFFRLLAAIIMAAVTIASAYPILSNGKSGSYGSVIIQGMSDPFRNYLKMSSAPYSFGARYSDELVLSSIAADARSDHPNWDTDEGQPVYGVSQAITLSGASWQTFFPDFMGDFVSQAFKSASWIIGFPLLAASDALPDPGYPVMMGPPVSIFMAPIYSLFAQHWMPWLGMAGMFIFFFRLWVKSRQEALALGVLFTALVTYPVVQFSIRHVFHLEFIWVLAMLSLLELPFTFREITRSGRSYPAVVAVISILGFSAYLLLVQRQQDILVRQFKALLSQPRQQVAEAVGVERPVRLIVPLPPQYAGLVASSADSMTPLIASIGIQWDVRSAADRLLLTVSGAGCSGEIVVSSNYTKRDDVWQPFDQQIMVPLDGSGEGTHVLIPAFYRPTQYLSDVSLDKLPQRCAVRLERMQGKTTFPSLLSAVLPPGWSSRSLHAGFGHF
ncbi:hypothetical protein HFO65_35985 [Rhizobium laguerreae]|uniref:hypothetical protein n=1 Tax=Rhizobium laguerreae TaxID=1076926 RepID=UPI001C91F9E4|nr:hypothetical protein [Rhizobium laguerreae]MBY3165954.1 hypothetical protein [Rhizobium laguerreae]